MEGTFFFITNEVEFQEASKKGAIILATFMELNKPSANNRIYRFEEGEQLAKSLIGKPIKFGANWLGKHIKNSPVIGKVLDAWQEGTKIKGKILITSKKFINKIKEGTKYLFSVGGKASFGEILQKGKQKFIRLWNALCTHLQMLPNDPKGAGFPSAKMDKILEINESIMYTDYNIEVCDEFGCKILSYIDNEFEEAKRKIIKEKAINMTNIINDDVKRMTKAIMKEPWLFLEEKD